MKTIRDLSPAALWRYFDCLCAIARPTGHMAPVSDFIEAFCSDNHLDYSRDAAGNFVIRKPASPGNETREAIILQAHLDMVCQYDDADIDPRAQGVLPVVDGDFVTARNSSLGADNGIGIAAILAILADPDLPHTPIEALLTVDEELGMVGVSALDASLLTGKRLVNTDFEQEGVVCIGCSGGTDMNVSFQYKEGIAIPEGDIAVEITLSGLKGGHSGVDIHLGRANAIKLMSRFLKEAVSDYGARLASFGGGSARNAIPRSARAVVSIPANNCESFWELVSDYRDIFADEYKGIEEALVFTAEQVPQPPALIPELIQDDLINAIEAVHNGVLSRLPDFGGAVETSSNLGIITTEPGAIRLKFLERSSSESRRYAACSAVESLFSLAGAKVGFDNDYPEWQPAHSAFADSVAAGYEKLFGTRPDFTVMHAGLECGILARLLPGVEIVAVGPDMFYPHSPSEKVSISSVDRFWRLLLEIVKCGS